MNAPGAKGLTLAAMVAAVAMMFIDQTIVAIAVPNLQQDLSLTATGSQWIVNGYLLALSAFFALGGKIADVGGRRRMLVVGVVGFATASALCGATPTTGIAEAWIITFRVLQGAFAALLFPAALAILVAAYPLRERGKKLAVFFALTGAMTSIGPIAGGYLTEWTWRAIFWINVPVAIVALVLIARARIADERHPGRIDAGGAALLCLGMGLVVLGLQQASAWGWSDGRTWACFAAGLALLAVFIARELRASEPLINVRIFADRGFAADNLVLGLMSVAFVPLFFFASLYAQICLGWKASEAGLYLLIFFGGFAGASQLGGRILDARGARPAVVAGCALAAAGFALWASKLPDLSVDGQWLYIVLAGAGIGLVLGPVSTDAVNRAPRTGYGEATGITQTSRNFGSSRGLAVLGSILIAQNTSRIESTLEGRGVPAGQADRVAQALSLSGGGDSGRFADRAGAQARGLFEAVQLDFAHSLRTVFFLMAAVMALAFVVALVAVPKAGSRRRSPSPLTPRASARRPDARVRPPAPLAGGEGGNAGSGAGGGRWAAARPPRRGPGAGARATGSSDLDGGALGP
jgi:EmrB/QacA subfamily drug resistance transporter